jgi:mannose-1-phosphate guanylyltransferase
MRESEIRCSKSAAPIRTEAREDGGLWAVVLAGGQGARLRPVTRQLYGEERPKQYATLIGSKSLLRQTLDRVALLIPPRRTVVVSLAGHARYLEAELAGFPKVHVLAQPWDRGTAAGVLLPAHWIHARDAHATVVVFPSDHFVVEEALFMRRVAEVARYVKGHPEWLILLGAQPTGPDADYGWIEPGGRVSWSGRDPIYRIRAFREKPPDDLARSLFTRGCLLNTFVFATRVAALIDAGLQCVPLLHDRLIRLGVFVGTQYEAWALRQAYRFAPTADFARAVLESPPLSLAVAPLPALTWYDLGTPERLVRSLRKSGAPRTGLATLKPSA